MTTEKTKQTIIKDLTEPIAEICQRYPTRRSAIMPALYLAQEKYGLIDKTTYQAISEILDVPEIWIFELASFYTLYQRKEMGKYHLQVCTNIPCMLRGAYNLVEHVQARLGIKTGETSKDGLFTLTTVECIGSCDVAPAMMVNQTYYTKLSKERVDHTLNQLSVTGREPVTDKLSGTDKASKTEQFS